MKQRQREMSSHTSKVKRRLLVVLIGSVICELVTLLVVVGHWRKLREEMLAPRQHQVCYKLDKFVATEIDKESQHCPEGLKQQFDKPKTEFVCCGDQSNVLDKLLAKAMNERYNSDSNPETCKLDLTDLKCRKATYDVAKVRLLDLARSEKQDGMPAKLLWNYQSPSNANTGLRYSADNGMVNVEKAGYYHVSSQLKTHMKKPSSTYSPDNILRHYVYLNSEGRERVLLEDSQSGCETASDTSETTSILGAVFKLEEGDLLYVATSHPETIVHDEHNNYFTVYNV